MRKALILFIFIISVNTVSGQSINKTLPPANKEIADPDSLGYLYYSQIFGFSLASKANLKLFDFVYNWMGTPYRFGGDSKKGIDCSRFVNKVYDYVYDVFLGGATSRDIYKNVIPVGKGDLREGDFVFFKIKKSYITHIGIYLGNGKFAHSASSKGVSVANLDDPYFKRYFYKGGRIE
jgi:lipoprotein Spr